MRTKTWTYGLELELADWDTRKGWEGYGRDPEPLIVNSNGVAADPRLKSYPFGGEITTFPTSTIEEQIAAVQRFRKLQPRAKVNYRSGLQVHIRVPGLADNLELLKRLQRCVGKYRFVFKSVYWQRTPKEEDFTNIEDYKVAKKRVKLSTQSATFVTPQYRIDDQLRAKTVEEFMAREAPLSKAGKVLYHAQRRSSVNIRQLFQTDTIEFRHSHCTFDEENLTDYFNWCTDLLLVAFEGGSLWDLYHGLYKDKTMCANHDLYDPILESRWKATTVSKNKRPIAEANIAAIVAGTFDDGPKCQKYLVWRKES